MIPFKKYDNNREKSMNLYDNIREIIIKDIISEG